MKNWHPDLSNTSFTVERGPRTRRLERPRRKAKRTLQIVSRLSGDRLAIWATRAARWFGNPALSVSYDKDRDIYLVKDTEVHAFAHQRRLWTLFGGHLSRGKALIYEYLLDQIDFSDGDRIIDVGANTGDLALAFRVIQRKVHIDAFEPSPGEYAALQHNLKSCSAVTSYSAHQLALWKEEAEGITFYLKAAKGDSSILPIAGATGEIKVPSRRLDDVLSAKDGRFKLLKLEAEGAEPEILEGASRLLPYIDYITADVGFERGLQAASTLPEVANFLIQNGFEIVGYGAGRNVLLFRNRAVAD